MEETRNDAVVTTADGKVMWKDANGSFVPVDNIPEIDKLRDEMVRQLVAKAEQLSQEMRKLKEEVSSTIDDYMELSMSQYGVRYSRKGNVFFKTYDGTKKIDVRISEFIEFDEQITAAKVLIDKCLNRWSEGANANLAIIIKDAFKVDKKGRLDTARILQLQTYQIDDPDWKEAMEAIRMAIKPKRSKRYIRFYKSNGDGMSIGIPIDWSCF